MDAHQGLPIHASNRNPPAAICGSLVVMARSIKFEANRESSNLPKICFAFVSKHRSNANDSFNPVWYGLHQRRENTAGG